MKTAATVSGNVADRHTTLQKHPNTVIDKSDQNNTSSATQSGVLQLNEQVYRN